MKFQLSVFLGFTLSILCGHLGERERKRERAGERGKRVVSPMKPDDYVVLTKNHAEEFPTVTVIDS